MAVNKKQPTEKELEELEAKGITCKNCEHYGLCGLGTTVLCFAYKALGKVK